LYEGREWIGTYSINEVSKEWLVLRDKMRHFGRIQQWNSSEGE